MFTKIQMCVSRQNQNSSFNVYRMMCRITRYYSIRCKDVVITGSVLIDDTLGKASRQAPFTIESFLIYFAFMVKIFCKHEKGDKDLFFFSYKTWNKIFQRYTLKFQWIFTNSQIKTANSRPCSFNEISRTPIFAVFFFKFKRSSEAIRGQVEKLLDLSLCMNSLDRWIV